MAKFQLSFLRLSTKPKGGNMTRNDLDDMVTAYVECALWAGYDWTKDESGESHAPLDENYGPDDLSTEALDAIRTECRDFYRANAQDLASVTAEQAGHDFYLTRNGHGAGFWDRGLGDLGDRLSAATKPYGTSDLYAGDDGKLYAA
jgi:hypothetical protein